MIIQPSFSKTQVATLIRKRVETENVHSLQSSAPKGGISVARQRIVKDPPKRGTLNRSTIKRVVEQVVYARRGLEVPTSSTGRKRGVTTIKVGRDVKTGRFISREEAERRTDTAVVETIKIPRKKK